MTSDNGALQESIASMTELLKEMYRPRLFFDILPSDLNSNLLEVLLRNSGGSAAYDISCTFSPDLPYYDDTTLSNLAVLKKLPFLEQGKELRFFYRSLIEIVEEGKAFGGKESTVTVNYFDSRKTSYKEEYTINLEKYRGILAFEKRGINDIFKELVNIRKEMEKIQSRGLLIKSPKDLEQERKELEDRYKGNKV